MRKGIFRISLVLFLMLLSLRAYSSETKNDPLAGEKPKIFRSDVLGCDIRYLKGVFNPWEAEKKVLPFMKEHSSLFRGKTVLDIGCGSGIISLYAARLGARKVIATDIDPRAILSVQMNAKEMHLDGLIEARLVPQTDISAYSVVKTEERFDVIISNPPYSIDLDSKENNTCIDRGDLGFSILRGLKQHMAPQGETILLYDSLFYHEVMVKAARYFGYQVKNYPPCGITPWERDTVFNAYLKRMLLKENLPSGALGFDWEAEGVKEVRIDTIYNDRQPDTTYPGIIIIQE